MSELKHTPGPWYISNATSKRKDGLGMTGTFDIKNQSVVDRGCKWLADVKPYGGEGFTDYEEAKAYAKLFAASTDMLNAIQCALNLKDLWSAQQHGTVSADHEGEMQALQNMQDMLEAALKKATA